ncbi:MAG: hypothetical protein IPO78_17425 [Saprospiraceae bacterium]|nr:hypothetical protein [Saprospiraceae bacterium]
MKYLILLFVIFSSCVGDNNFIPFLAVESSFSDSDCDGIADSQDLRNGGNDAIDLNNDNLPDIVYLVDYATLNPAWKCGAPYQEKAYCCKKHYLDL